MTNLRWVRRIAVSLLLFTALVRVAWSQTAGERTRDAKTPADVQSVELIFTWIERDLPPIDRNLPRGNYLHELGKLASSYEIDANKGDWRAQFKIAALYLEGLGVRTNSGEAAHWFATAGGADHPLALYAEGKFYQRSTQGSSDSHVRRAVFDAIGSIGPQAELAIPVLEKEMEHDQRDGRDAAVALGKIGERGVPSLLKGLASKDVGRRRVAVEGLSEAREASRIAVPQLTTMLKDEDERTRYHAECALLRLGIEGVRPDRAPKVAPDTTEFIQGLQSSDEKERKQAAEALAKLEGDALPAMKELVAALKDDSPAVRAASAEALRNLRENARSAIPQLIAALRDDEATVRANAAEAIAWIGPGTEDPVPHLIKAMSDADDRVRSNAARAFLTKWTDGQRAIPFLLKGLDDTGRSFGMLINSGYSLRELARQGHSQAVVQGLVEFLQRSGTKGELTAITTLKDIGADAKSAIPVLKAKAESADARIRGAAVAAISHLGGTVDEGMPRLIRGLRNDDWQIQEAAARSIRDIGPAASSTVPALVSLLDDQDRQAFEKFKLAAEKGVLEAQFELAMRYRNGKGTASDFASFHWWLKKAADQGHSEAQRNLGILYRQGRGVTKDDTQAEILYRKAVAGDGALPQVRHAKVHQEAYVDALAVHRTMKSEYRNNDLILALTTFNEDATHASHFQVETDGTVDAFLEIYNWSRRGGGGYKLTPSEMERMGTLLKALPAGVEYAPLQQRMIVSCQVGDQWLIRTFDNQDLSPEMRLLLDLIRAPAPDDPFPAQERLSWSVKSDPPINLAYRSDGTLCSWGTERALLHWRDGKPVVKDNAVLESLRGRPIAASSNRVVTEEAQMITLWDTKSGKHLVDLGQHGAVFFSADEQTLVTLGTSGNQQHCVRVWDAATGRLRGEVQPVQYARVMAVSADGLQLAACCDGKVTRIWSLETFQVTHELADSVAVGLAFSPDGKSLAALIPEYLTMWDLNTGERRFQARTATWSQLLRITPDGKTIVSVQGRRTIKRWDARDGRILGIAAGHTADITAIAISPDSKEVASASEDGTIKLWNIERLPGPD